MVIYNETSYCEGFDNGKRRLVLSQAQGIVLNKHKVKRECEHVTSAASEVMPRLAAWTADRSESE